MSRRNRPVRSLLDHPPVMPRPCKPRSEPIYLDGTVYEPDSPPCPVAGCWGVLNHAGLHSDGHASWSTK